ncbi:CYTH domain-containing protein [Desulfuromonas versatilis]|uniref:CYTH domain-containing protein n=1 Tax=Desulfuromonas versatilis TaxID=2802975 RepID=A0ABM8HXW5_9BACT|nr:CYTH domain-containing protein [Desulfuromonas versatilis]BCR06812.1 CYTH domain-containing protein [Desulfuromonas versatilis]
MPMEIERKFLVSGDQWRQGAHGTLYRQGYLCTDPERTVRVRLAGDRGTLTIKGKTEGISRAEFEYPIPAGEAAQLLDRLCLRPLIEKRRYRVEYGGRIWEVDEFFGDNAGLVLAEVELETESAQVELPSWVFREVSDDPRYFNASLVKKPFCTW